MLTINIQLEFYIKNHTEMLIFTLKITLLNIQTNILFIKNYFQIVLQNVR